MRDVHGIGLNSVTLFIFTWIFTLFVITTSTSGSCQLPVALTKDVTCKPDLSETNVLEENIYCRHNLKNICYKCVQQSLQEVPCSSVPLRRHKRFFKKLVRRIFGRTKKRITNTPPSITCPSISSTITASSGTNTAAVTWSAPRVSDRENNIRSTQLTSGKGSGSRFSEGSNTVSYRVTDTHGQAASCSVSFTVKVIRCPSPPSPSHGRVQCASTVGTVYGTKCTYSCNTGFQLEGASTVTCQRNGVFTTPPTCQKIQCGNLPVPTNAGTTSCTDGNKYQSVCVPTCNQGYAPARGAKAICAANRKWSQSAWKCEDIVKPIYTNCPTKKINTIDKMYRWTVTATDNTGKVTLKQVQGHEPGSLMPFGVHVIKYVATDDAGNSANCVFTIELKRSDCPRPSSSDNDMKFMCNGLSAQSVCHLTCRSGSYVQGSKYIVCTQDTSENNTSVWKPLDGQSSTCFKKTCPSLSPPKNGALVCDKQLGGTVCQMNCDDRFDVAQGEATHSTYICGNDAEVWTPSNVVPDCLEMAYPDEYFLPTEFFYFLGDCSDAAALREIKQQFIDNLNSVGLSPCMKDECSVDDIEVQCGDREDVNDFTFKRKRRAAPNVKRVVKVKVTFHLKNSNRTISPEAAKVLLKSLAAKSKTMMSTNTAMRKMLQRSIPRPSAPGVFARRYNKNMRIATTANSRTPPQPLPTLPPKVKSKSVTGNLSVNCAVGQVQSKSKPGVCVPCSVGTYADNKTLTCEPCPRNTYQDTSGAIFCQRCPPDHATSSTGSTTRGACKELCRPESFSPSGNVPCYPCPARHYQSVFGAKTCFPCSGSNVRGQRSLKCSEVTKTSTNVTIPPELKIADFLLTCDSQVCLSF